MFVVHPPVVQYHYIPNFELLNIQGCIQRMVLQVLMGSDGLDIEAKEWF